MDRVRGKIALVTGGASGIGRGIALALAREGATVVITDVSETRGRDVVGELNAAGSNAGAGPASFIQHDVSREEDWVRVIAEIERAHGRLDVLVNNAGIFIAGYLTEFALADFQKLYEVNLDGVFLGIKHGLPLMRMKGGGSLINISSTTSHTTTPALAAYASTKAAVAHLSRCIAIDCGQQKDGIRVNSIHPGVIDTPVWGGLQPGKPGRTSYGEEKPDLDAFCANFVPLGRTGTPDDIADGVVFLASDESVYVTGIELAIDGGSLLR
jgi:NAD(P)-dependent dehydrogenase (short-subunit alcohol dehydrogenase family)